MLEKIVTDLETSKRLKDLGFYDSYATSESKFVYWKGKVEYYDNLPFSEINKITDLITGYTLDRILIELPKSFTKRFFFTEIEEKYSLKFISGFPFVGYYSYDGKVLVCKENVNCESLATTAAKLWIKLKEDKII